MTLYFESGYLFPVELSKMNPFFPAVFAGTSENLHMIFCRLLFLPQLINTYIFTGLVRKKSSFEAFHRIISEAEPSLNFNSQPSRVIVDAF